MKNHFFNACVKSYVKNQMILSDARSRHMNEIGASTVEYVLVIAVIVFGIVAIFAGTIPVIGDFFMAATKKVAGMLAGS